MDDRQLPGSSGEHAMQDRCGTTRRAEHFYDTQMLDHLNEQMQEFISRIEMAFVATSDAHGECDCSLRAGLPGFIRVLDDRTITYPEYRGNGVMASLGNIGENAHIGLLMVDFYRDTVGLHVNGRASVVENDEMAREPDLPFSITEDIARGGGRKPERWVVVEVEEAYIHCSKHIPLLVKADKSIAWGTDDIVRKGGDYFGARRSERSWAAPAPDTVAPEPADDPGVRHPARRTNVIGRRAGIDMAIAYAKQRNEVRARVARGERPLYARRVTDTPEPERVA